MMKQNKQMMNNFIDINSRISYLIENKTSSNKKKFAEIIGFAPQVISNIVSGRRSKPSYDVLFAIVSSFDDVSSEWLLTGNGSILKTDTINMEPLDTSEKEQYQRTIHLLENTLKDKEKIIILQEQRIESLKKGDFELSPLSMVAEKGEEYPENTQLKDGKREDTRLSTHQKYTKR